MGTLTQTGGLSDAEAARRLAEAGPNALPEAERESWLHRLGRQFRSPLIYILLFALALELGVWFSDRGHGWPLESVVIGLILLLNAGLGLWQEGKAEAALSKLNTLAAPQALVLRGGEWKLIASRDLAPGDVIRLGEGDRVPADGVMHGSLSLDESMLTGESMAVDKGDGEEVFSGTLAVSGHATVEITRTGASSALGRVAGMLGGVQAEPTPLERRISVFGKRVARWVVTLAVLIAVGGLLAEGIGRLGPILLFAVAIAVAAVPEGLPAVLTFTLALGVERMARRKAVVRRLSSVESLGSVTVIATDKTGTLTENRMEVQQLDAPSPELAIRAFVLANDASGNAGDPVDRALMEWARAAGHDPEAMRDAAPRIAEQSFSSARKFMNVTVREEGGGVTYWKGAPEVLLQRSALSESGRREWTGKAHEYASNGFRVLGAARGGAEKQAELEFLGMVLFWDPPRAEVPGAIRECRDAGIRVLMITGDHPETALAIAERVGISASRAIKGEDLDAASPEELRRIVAEENVFARVLPEHKLMLVEALQQQGQVVAMTGDGVNDAPALKKSDVGVAMGQRGSDVSREVADLVLLDDNFATIVNAVEEGRSIYENIQKFIRFLFSTNLSEVLVVTVGVVIAAFLGLRDAAGGIILPLTAVQILWINLVTDGLPALTLAADRNPGLMRNRPRPPETPLLESATLRFVVMSGTVKALFALAILWIVPQLGYSLESARSATFHFMAVGQLLFSYPARHTRNIPRRNLWLHGAVAAGVLLQLAVGTSAWAAAALDAPLLEATLWILVLMSAIAAWGVAEIVNRFVWRPGEARAQ